MRLHTNTLTDNVVRAAAQRAGVALPRYTWHNSRTHQGAYEVILSGSGARRSQYRESDVPAATWDEWGMFLAALYRIDPSMRAGSVSAPIYANSDHFHWATDYRYQSLTPAEQHRLHRWTYSGQVATHAYSVSDCRCGAVRRWLNGVTWANLTEPGPETPAPAESWRETPVAERVAQLRTEVADPEYWYDRAADLMAIRDADSDSCIPMDTFMTPVPVADNLPPAAQAWVPRRQRVDA